MATALNGFEDVNNLLTAEEQMNLQAMWKHLGKRLHQTPDTLRVIENNHPQNDKECLKEMIERWLKQPEADKDKLRYFVKILTEKPKLEELINSVEDLKETEMRKLAKNLKLGDGSVHYNIKSTSTMLQQWLDHSKNPTWAEFTLAMDKVGFDIDIEEIEAITSMTTSEHNSNLSHFKCVESDDDFDDDDEWISEFLKQDEKDTHSEPLPDIITVPEPEREYTDLFQRLFVDGISMKPAVLSAILENKNIKSVSLGFSKHKPVLRIASSTQVNSTLITDFVTTQLSKYISEHHKSVCDKNEIEKMIKISQDHPMQVAEFQGGIPGGEFIMTYDQQNWPAICTGLLYVKMDITMEGITKKYDAHVPILPFHCVLPAENENFRGKLPDLIQQPDIKVQCINEQLVTEAPLLKGKDNNPHLMPTLLKATIFPEKATQEMQVMEENGMHYFLVGQHLKGFLTGKAGLIRKTENNYIPVLVSSEIEVNIPPSAIQFRTHPCTLDVAACKFIIDYEQVQGCSFQEAFQTIPELHEFNYFGPPSKMDEAKGKIVVIQDGKMETLADNLFKIEFSVVKDGELLVFPCFQWKRDASVDLEIKCGSPVFVLDAVSKSLHFLGGLYSRETAFHAAFALNIMKPAICHHLATQIIAAMKVEERDKLEILQKSRKESVRKLKEKEIDSVRCLIEHVLKYKKRLDRLQKRQVIMNQQTFIFTFEQLLNRGIDGNITCTFQLCTKPH